MKEHKKVVEADACPDERLPCRLFATDRYPDARINVYSKPSVLAVVKDVLRGGPEFERIRGSYFGRLFEIPVSRCPISCKLIHALLCRQLLSKKKYEMWIVFGGQPLRFSLAEFGSMSGLNCGEFPDKYKFKSKVVLQTGPGTFWNSLIGPDKDTTLGDIQYMLQHSDDMPAWRKLALSLLLIVDGVLVSTQQYKKPTHKYVKMLEDIDSFLKFPWGRESFIHTVKAMRPGKQPLEDGEDPVLSFQKKLQQSSFSLVGFPLVLQLLAFEAIPGLLLRMPNSVDNRTFLERENISLGKLPSLTRIDVLDVEYQDDLKVTPLLELEDVPEVGWGEWDDERIDREVAYMEKLIKDGHVFRKAEWPGGLDSLPLINHVIAQRAAVHKKHIGTSKVNARETKGKGKVEESSGRVNKKKKKKTIYSSNRKQRKLNDYYCAAKEEGESSTSFLKNEILELREALEKLEKRTAEIERRVTAKNSKRNRHCSKKLNSLRWQSSKKKSERCRTRKRINSSPIMFGGETPIRQSESLGEGEGNGDGSNTVNSDWDKYGGTLGVLDSLRDNELYEDGTNGNEIDQCGGHENVVPRQGGSEVELSVKAHHHGGEDCMVDDKNNVNGGREPVVGVEARVNVDRTEKAEDHRGEDCMVHDNNDLNVGQEPVVGSEVGQVVDESVKTAEHGVEDSIVKDNIGQFGGQNTLDPTQQEFQESGNPDENVGTNVGQFGGQETVDDVEPSEHGGREIVVRDSLLCPLPGLQSDSLLGTSLPLFADTEGTVYSIRQEDIGGMCLSIEGLEDTPSVPNHLGQTRKEDEVLSGGSPVYVSDSSPLREKLKHVPSLQEEQLAIMLLSRPKDRPMSLLPIVNDSLFQYYKTTLTENSSITHITNDGYQFDNNFLLVLAKREEWVSTLHIEVMVSLLRNRHTSILAAERSCIVFPWLINHLQGKYRKFHGARDKKTFRWGDDVERCIVQHGQQWLVNVDTVYIPMIWNNRHWVGLVINLKLWSIEVLDPCISLYADRKVEEYMLPVTRSLPYLLRAYCKPELMEKRSLDPFVWRRIKGIYVNQRSGDCGPVTMKFIEIHAYGNHDDGMGNMTDELVDHFRKQYSMDVYEEMVVPLYVGQKPSV